EQSPSTSIVQGELRDCSCESCADLSSFVAERFVPLISMTAGVGVSGSAATKQTGTTGEASHSTGSTLCSAPTSKKPAQVMIFQQSTVRPLALRADELADISP